MTTTTDITYLCGCEASGDNVSPLCPMHGKPIAKDNTTMTAEKIKVMQAFEDGKAVQCFFAHSKRWKDHFNPCWDWANYDYRIKPTYPEPADP